MFRKIVSYLAYSPAMLWKLGRLNDVCKKDAKRNRLVIGLIILNILILLIILLGAPPNTPITIAPHHQDMPPHTTGRIELESSADPIENSQAISYRLYLTNNSNEDINQNIKINLDGVKNYLVPIFDTNSRIVYNTDEDSATWLVRGLQPGQTKTANLNFQSLNSFGYFPVDNQDNCQIKMSFGNSIVSKMNCNKFKLLQINLAKPKHEKIILIATIVILLLLWFVKLLYQAELTLTIKEIKILRQYINRGQSL